MLNLPMGHVVKLRYRDSSPQMVADTSVFDVFFHAPDGKYYHHVLPNNSWNVDNPTLQFMALNDIRPSDFDGASLDVSDQHWLVQLAVSGYSFRLHQNALSGGTAALEEAEWFAPHDGEESNSGQSEPIGGGSDDNGGGQVGITLADDESDSGFLIEVVEGQASTIESEAVGSDEVGDT